jgi:hypothetical protein
MLKNVSTWGTTLRNTNEVHNKITQSLKILVIIQFWNYQPIYFPKLYQDTENNFDICSLWVQNVVSYSDGRI